MNSRPRAILAGMLILSATIAYRDRYSVAAMPGGGALVTDRWRGTVSLCMTPTDNITVVCFPRYPARYTR
jgi:hypothetical protein